MNKKKVLIGVSSLFIIVLIITLSITLSKSGDNVILSDNENNTNFINNSFLTLMLEQSDGSYQESTTNTWPTGNYAFNSELSRCENGGELRWDRENDIVELLSNKSDACYVYFDLYNVVTITNVSSSKTTNSVTLTVTVDAGENPVATYYFSMDGGRSYQTSNTNTYTFSNLNYGTSYTFQVYAVDTQGYESNEETIEVTTDNYVNPVVNSVTAINVTNNSITVSVNASGGTNNIQRYYYSINNGSYTNSSSNSYTFSGLSAGQSYSIRVYVRDTNGVDSNVYTINAETYSLEYYFAIGTKLESDGYNCGPAGTLCYLDYKTSNFQVGGTHALTYLTSFTFDKVYEVKESYYIDFTPVGAFSYEMGNEYALRHNYLVLDTQSGSTIYSYGYRLNMGPDYYDLCIVYKNGAIVVDCNTENWWDANLY